MSVVDLVEASLQGRRSRELDMVKSVLAGNWVRRSILRWQLTLGILLTLVLTSCGQTPPSGQKETDPAFRFGIEQIRFMKRGVFPFDFLIGRAFIDSDKVLPSNSTWYPDEKSTAIRIFEDGVERPVLTVSRISDLRQKTNILVVALVTEGLVVGQGGGKAVHPGFRDALKGLAQGFDENLFNLAVVLCWGKNERRYAFTTPEMSQQYVADMDALVYPGVPEGNFMGCIEPNIADFDWLQRATPEQAQEAALKNGTLPHFFKDNQNGRSAVILVTDGEPFREGSIDVFSDLIVKSNLSLYTVGLAANTEGEKGLARIRDLYERRKMGGSFVSVEQHEKLPKTVKSLIDRWMADGYSFVVDYVSGFSGIKGTELTLWGTWKDGQYTSRQIRVQPGTYNQTLRIVLRSLVILALFGLFIFTLYYFKIWPFREKVRVVNCPEGCGHLIPEDWPVCKFCETKGVWGRLIILNGDKAGEVFFLKNDYYSVGSGKEDDIVVTHLGELPVKPNHASIHWVQQGQKIVLRVDGGKASVARKNIDSGAVNLRFGDVMELGEGGVAAMLLRGVGRTY